MIPAPQPRPSSPLPLTLTLTAALTACSAPDASLPDAGIDAFRGPARALFEVPRGGTPPPSGFYALPFPNDIRIDDHTGAMRLDDYIRPNTLIGLYIDAIRDHVRGFSVTAASFVRFDAPIDPASLPRTPDDTFADNASVYLVNVDQDSPNHGERVPLLFRFETYPGQTIGANWLSALPYPGFVLDERTTYALVVTNRLLATDGSPIGVPDDFAAVMAEQEPSDFALQRARILYLPLTQWLDQPGGDERADVVVASVFTTQDATSLMGAMREVIWSELPMPQARDLVRQLDEDGEELPFYWYDGVYDAPCFQAGVPPFERPEDGGNIVSDADGRPIIQRVEPLRFSYTVPRGPMPATGWPVVLYAHGTGGSYHSFVNGGVAARLAEQGLAVISIDQVMHPPRIPPGDSPELLFFNFQNPLSARDNTLQGAADDFQLLRLALAFDVTDTASGPDAPGRMRFDPDRMYFFGHSQGGLTGPPFLAHEPLIDGAVLSGAGGLLYLSLTLKTEPVDIAALVASFIRDYPLDHFNPVLALLQTYMDRADPVVYGKRLAREPLPGIPAKHIYQSEGFIDNYTPTASIEALAVSMAVDHVEPVLAPLEGLRLREQPAISPPVTGNRYGVTAVLLQYEQAPGEDGHFVVFDVPAAQYQSSYFLGSLARTGAATLDLPN